MLTTIKMKKLQVFTLFSFLAIATISCKEQKKDMSKEAEVEHNLETTTATAKNSITLVKLEGSPAYEDASLELQSPKDGKISKGGDASFSFNVKNYELGAQTQSSNTETLANSGKGQHIHFIVNNQPYSAHYTAAFAKEVPDGVHHLVAFLSRSYHESVKNDNSVVVQKLEVGSNPIDNVGLDMNSPTLIYSRPKGEYAGKATENILLDFFVLNTTLSEDGNKVRATINGAEFIITEWVPHVIKGLSMGEVTIKLELIDAQGTIIPGPFNKVSRSITLKQ